MTPPTSNIELEGKSDNGQESLVRAKRGTIKIGKFYLSRQLLTVAEVVIITLVLLVSIIVVGKRYSTAPDFNTGVIDNRPSDVAEQTLQLTGEVINLDLTTASSSMNVNLQYIPSPIPNNANITCVIYEDFFTGSEVLQAGPHQLAFTEWQLNYTTTLLWTGSISRYPFDKHTTAVGLLAFTVKSTNCSAQNYNLNLDGSFLVSATLQPNDNSLSDFDLTIAENLDERENPYAVITIHRSFASLIFPIIFLIISWMLTICFVVVTIIIANLPPDTSMRDFMLPAVATLGITFLFALPTVRATLPGIPLGATLLDGDVGRRVARQGDNASRGPSLVTTAIHCWFQIN